MIGASQCKWGGGGRHALFRMAGLSLAPPASPWQVGPIITRAALGATLPLAANKSAAWIRTANTAGSAGKFSPLDLSILSDVGYNFYFP